MSLKSPTHQALLRLLCLALLVLHCPAFATAKRTQSTSAVPAAHAMPTGSDDGLAEARLVEGYQLMASGRGREALEKVGKVVQEYPTFQLAQLVYGDLLATRMRPVLALGDMPPALAATGGNLLVDLREEFKKRVKAHSDRPQTGTIPGNIQKHPARHCGGRITLTALPF